MVFRFGSAMTTTAHRIHDLPKDREGSGDKPRPSCFTMPGLSARGATRVGASYMSLVRAQEFGDRNAVRGEVLVRITPERAVAHVDITGSSV
jgi:hypothetical protein